MKRIFIIDWALIPLFILTEYTGIELHNAGHGNIHEIWYNWAVFHVVMSLLFLLAVIFHIITHWNWYKGIVCKGMGRNSKVTLCLSIMFILAAITGIALLNIDGANSPIGIWHYKIGIIASVLSVGHILKRISFLHKSLK